MITFELYRQLDIRLFQTLAVVDPGYGACAKYILDGDSFIILGSDHSIRLEMPSKSMTTDVPMKNWDIETEAVLWFSEDSNEAALIRLICSVFRYYLHIDQYSIFEEFTGMIAACNTMLEQYDLKVIVDDSGMYIFHQDGNCTFEQAISIIMDVDENRMDNGGIVELINEALYYRKLDRMEEAAVRLEKVIRYADHTLPLYTDSVFLLAETYYFAGNFDRAIQLYYRCNMEFIEDEDDFYIHLGHALLDTRMKKYERQIRIYYRGRIDAEYADTHRQAVAASKIEIGEVFDEYEATCLEMGRKKYAEYRNSLPIGADDIDELLVFEKNEKEEEVEEVKRYKDLKLQESHVCDKDIGRSVQEMFSKALTFFMDGDYQDAFDIYSRIKEEVAPDSDYATWVHYMRGKMYCIFDEPQKADDELRECDVNKFGKVYRQEDFLVLYSHVRIICEDFESDPRFRVMIRGRLDNYFSQYDREYNSMLRDRELMKNYRNYETECLENARRDFANSIVSEDEETIVPKGFWSRLKNSFTGKS